MVLAAAFMLFYSHNVGFAQAHLQEANPSTGAELTESISELTLTFDSNIEDTSSVNIFNTQGIRVEIAGTIIYQEQLKVILEEPLANGEYKVDWAVTGADGQASNGDYRFVINAEEVEQTKEDDNAMLGDSHMHEGHGAPGVLKYASILVVLGILPLSAVVLIIFIRRQK